MNGHAAQVHVFIYLFIHFILFFNQCFSISQEVFLFLFYFILFILFFYMRFRLNDLTMWLKECWKHCLAVC